MSAVNQTVSPNPTGLTMFRQGELYICPKGKPSKGEAESAKRLQKFVISANVTVADNSISVEYGISVCSHKEENYNWTLGRRTALNRKVQLSKLCPKRTEVNDDILTLETSNVFAFEGIEKKFDIIYQTILKVGDVKEFLKQYTNRK